jgi:catechol 2,3-dioxygenase-like lactoylglutathione lyase family enzyme
MGDTMADSTPRITDVRPFVGAEDFVASRAFYVALGWRVVHDSETLCVMELQGHRFYLQNYHVKEWCENTMLHISVEDVNQWYQYVKCQFDGLQPAGAARLGPPPKDEGHATVFYVWDPSGVLLHFAQWNVAEAEEQEQHSSHSASCEPLTRRG